MTLLRRSLLTLAALAALGAPVMAGAADRTGGGEVSLGNPNAKVKVIFENALLKEEHKRMLCRICGEVRADWVKTSTGYAETGATVEDLKLMRECSPPWVQVKAAGGIRDTATALRLLDAGATVHAFDRDPDAIEEPDRFIIDRARPRQRRRLLIL